MTTRLLALPAILVALFTVSGCNGSADPPQAPEPRAKGEKSKPTAELLIGTWKRIMLNGKQVPPDRAEEIEFSANGNYVIRVYNPKTGEVGIKRGRYTLEGQALRLASESEVDAGQVWVSIVTSITEDEFATSEPPGSDSVRDVVFRRIMRA